MRSEGLSCSLHQLEELQPIPEIQESTTAPILAFYPYYYSGPGHSVSVVGGLFPGAIECRGAVSAQTVGVLPGTPGSAPQAHRRSALLLGSVVSTIQLESVIDDRQPETLIGWHRKSFKPFWRWMEGDSLRQRRT